jgi:hypothetical protein
MQSVEYEAYLKLKADEHESRCLRCGVCCGSLNDPCQHLQKLDENKYACKIYDNRLGTHKTIKGNNFTCVSIKDLIKKNATAHNCAYSGD